MQPTIKFRIGTVTYLPEINKVHFGVEFQSDIPTKLFGMNVRFFYDGAMFKAPSASTVKFISFIEGYSAFSPNPPYFGNSTAGQAYFKLSTKSSPYVNGAIQLSDLAKAPVLDNTSWTRIFTIELEPHQPLQNTVCPIIIWDKKSDPTKGGFVPNSAGVVLTIVKEETATILTAPALEHPIHLNWKQTSETAPFGEPNLTYCFSI